MPCLQVHTQSQELADVKIQAKKDGDRMCRLYSKSYQEAKTIPEEVQNKAKNPAQERKAADQWMKKDFEWKFKEFTRALQMKL
jgi:hypothetical protein